MHAWGDPKVSVLDCLLTLAWIHWSQSFVVCLCKDSIVFSVSSKAVFLCWATKANERCYSLCLCAYSFMSAAENVISYHVFYLSIHYQSVGFILAVLCEWLNYWRMCVFLMQVFIYIMYCSPADECTIIHYRFWDYLVHRMGKVIARVPLIIDSSTDINLKYIMLAES